MLGARPTAIQAALGHASIQMTERYLRADKQQAARTVAGVLSQLSGRRAPRPGRKVR